MPSKTPLSQVPLRPSTLKLLQQCGFETLEEVLQTKQKSGISTLAQELNRTPSETMNLLRELEQQQASNATQQPATSALSLLQSRKKNHPQSCIISFSKQLDHMLGGGFSLGELTEVCGMPGAGKTQLGMQLCVNVSIPQAAFGGLEGQALFIDTEGSFSPHRCQDMANALLEYLQRSGKTIPSNYSLESILKSIHVMRVYDEATQIALLESSLESRLSQNPAIRLIVVDSIAFHHRSNEDFRGRSRQVVHAASCLTDLAQRFNVAVVVTNQMTTTLKVNSNGNAAGIIPALGEAWAHAVTTRLILEKKDSPALRLIRLVKSPHKACQSARIAVNQLGIRDAPSGTEKENHAGDGHSVVEHKRLRVN